MNCGNERGQAKQHRALRLFRYLGFGFLGASLLGTTGCDGFFVPNNTPSGSSGNYLYVANSGNTYIAGFSIATSGALSTLNNAPYNNGLAVLSLAITPNNSLLYAATSNGIYSYAINSDGSLSIENGGSPVAQDLIPTVLQVDATGNYLLAAGISSAIQAQAIGIYQISSNGTLSAQTGSPLQLYTGSSNTATLATPTSLLITPNNSFVYVSLGNLGVQVLTLGSGGALSTGNSPTILPPSSKSSSPSDYGLASDPNSKFLFVAEINTGLRVLSIGTGGSLNEITGSPYTGGTGTVGVIVDPTGSYVYTANKGSNNISGYTLNASSGQLTQLSGSPFAPGGQTPIAFANDYSGQYMAVINSGSNGSSGNNDLQLFSRSATTGGVLSAGSSASTGTDPTYPSAIAATHPSS